MAVFSRRPLMLCCFCFMAAAVLGFCVNGIVKIIVMSVLFLSAATFCILSFVRRQKQDRITFAVVAVAMLFGVVSLAESFIYYDVHTENLERYIGKECEVECTVLSENEVASYRAEYTVRLISLNGEKVSGLAAIQLDEDMGFDPGERIRLFAECVPLKEITLGNSDRIALMSDGISVAFISDSSLDEIAVFEDSELLRESFGRVQKKLSYKLGNAVGGDAGKLSAAVALGDRARLDDEINRDFARSGLSHLLSLSGMHMAVISVFFCYLMKFFYMPKMLRSLIMPVIMLVYLCLTGFSLSTLRAAIMLSAVYLSFVFGVRTDARTVLFSTGAVILAAMPYAVCDAGFWMSFLATFGLIVFYPAALERDNATGKVKHVVRLFLKKILASLLVTVIATLSVILLTQMFFGELSLVSPISNLFAGPAVMLITVLSMVWLLISGIPYVNTLLIYLIRPLCNFVIWLSEKCSDIKNICVSFEPLYAKVIVWCFCAVAAVLMIIKLKNKRIMLLAPIGAVIIFAVCFGVSRIINNDNADVTYIRRGESETVTAVTNGKSVMFDMTDGNYTNYVFAWNEAHANGATELDALILTHYHDKHEYSVNKLMSSVKVRRIMIPEPDSREELWIAEALKNIADRHGAECVTYKPDEHTQIFGELAFLPYESGRLDRSEQDTIAFRLTFGQDSIVYVGSSYFESMGEYVNEDVCETQCIIYGSHGPNPKKEFSAKAINTSEEAVFADMELFELAKFDAMLPNKIKITVDCEKYKTDMNRGEY